MQKRLNPGLFDAQFEARNSEKLQNLEPSRPVYKSPTQQMESQKVFEELQELKGKMRSYEMQMDVFKNQMSDFVRTIDQRFERVSQALSRMEKSVHNQGRDNEEKVKQLREKIQSQSFEESKLENLMERQTLVVRNFENRLSAMQKILNEKEVLLMKYVDAFKKQLRPER